MVVVLALWLAAIKSSSGESPSSPKGEPGPGFVYVVPSDWHTHTHTHTVFAGLFNSAYRTNVQYLYVACCVRHGAKFVHRRVLPVALLYLISTSLVHSRSRSSPVLVSLLLHYGSCPQPAARSPSPGCSVPSVCMLRLTIPRRKGILPSHNDSGCGGERITTCPGREQLQLYTVVSQSMWLLRVS